jgi:aryl-alcohol dehydrogenase-like predicted oxidoreductase
MVVGTGAVLGLTGRPLSAEPAELIRKSIPSTGEMLPAIGVGTNRYITGTDAENRVLHDTLATFSKLGGELIDTAPMYRSSETILGQLIAKTGIRKNVFLATKADRAANDGGIERLENSFHSLQTDMLDLVQSHNLIGVDSMLPVLQEYKEEGRIRYVGITTSRNAQFEEIVHWMKKTPLDFIQVNYSLADRQAAEQILPLAREKGIAVLTNLPLGRGQLFKTVGIRTLPDWAAEFDCNSWAQFFLKYVISHPAVTCAIPGMTKVEHVIDNMGAMTGRLPNQAERRQMEEYLDSI